jgi:hypothetical protein
MINIALLKNANAHRWQDMRVIAGLMAVIDKTASRLIDPDAKPDMLPSPTGPACLGLSSL